MPKTKTRGGKPLVTTKVMEITPPLGDFGGAMGKGYRYGFNSRKDAKSWAEKNVGGKEQKPLSGGRATKGSYLIKPMHFGGKHDSYTVYYKKKS